MSRTLDVHLQGRLVGHLEQDDTGQMGFSYDSEWLASADRVPLSQSLPLRSEHFSQRECRPFFAGLLPEGDVREGIAHIFHITPSNDFKLLERIGGECAGAVSLLPPSDEPLERPSGDDYRILSESELAGIIHDLPKRPLLAGQDGVRLSLAGAQEKLPVRILNGQFAIPLFGAPTSHILKPPIRAFQDTVVNEGFCLEVARRMGLHVVRSEIQRIGGEVILVVERYDRVSVANQELRRMHQEDFCQALGVPPELKYQNEGGPSLADCFDLVRKCASTPAVALQGLLNLLVFNFLIGNRDAHAKNFSLLYTDEGTVLAPAYDILSTEVYPELSRRLAMKIGGKYEPAEVRIGHWEAFAREAGLSAPQVRRRVLDIADQLIGITEQVRADFDGRGHNSPILDAVVRSTAGARKKLRSA